MSGMSSTYPTLHIVTGPPGSGKTTFAETKNVPIYDNDLGNLREWISMPPHEAVLTVTAPQERKKSYWMSIAKQNGYVPKLYCIWLSKMEAHQRASMRPVRNDKRTFDWIKYWFKNYTRHPQEERITNVRSAAS